MHRMLGESCIPTTLWMVSSVYPESTLCTWRAQTCLSNQDWGWLIWYCCCILFFFFSYLIGAFPLVTKPKPIYKIRNTFRCLFWKTVLVPFNCVKKKQKKTKKTIFQHYFENWEVQEYTQFPFIYNMVQFQFQPIRSQQIGSGQCIGSSALCCAMLSHSVMSDSLWPHGL